MDIGLGLFSKIHPARKRIAHFCTWDRMGILTSGFCVLHCVLVSLLLLLYPFSVQKFEDQTHSLLFFLVVPIAAFSLVRGFTHHRKIPILLAGTFGIGLLVISLGSHSVFLSEELEHGVATLGSLSLIWAHYKNLKACPHPH